MPAPEAGAWEAWERGAAPHPQLQASSSRPQQRHSQLSHEVPAQVCRELTPRAPSLQRDVLPGSRV